MEVQHGDFEKVRGIFRVLASIVCILASIAFIIIIYVLIVLQFNWIGLIGLVPLFFTVHITFTVSQTGLPPQYLLWSSPKTSEREMDPPKKR